MSPVPHRRGIRSRLVAALAAVGLGITLSVAAASPASATTLCTNSSCSNWPQWSAVMSQPWWGQTAGHNCTNYVAWRLSTAGVADFIGMGNANTWDEQATAAGYVVNNVAAPGAVAVWESASIGPVGHVAYVESVSGSTMTISEDSFNNQVFHWTSTSTSSPDHYIHIPGVSGGSTGNTSIIGPGDFDGDGLTDILGIRPNGTLQLYSGDGAGGFLSNTGTQIGPSNWGAFRFAFSPGDFDGDGNSDVLAVSTSGNLSLYRGNGAGGWLNGGSGTIIGSGGWATMTNVFSPGDFDGDGNPDVMGVSSTGKLNLYRGNGAGGWVSPSGVQISASWGGFVYSFSPGDFDGDGNSDVFGVTPGGQLTLYKGNGTGGWVSLSGTAVGQNWTNFTDLGAPGDFDGDGNVDVLAVTTAGKLYRYIGNGSGGWLNGGSGIFIATGW